MLQKLPPIDWFKLNFDGLIHDDKSRAGFATKCDIGALIMGLWEALVWGSDVTPYITMDYFGRRCSGYVFTLFLSGGNTECHPLLQDDHLLGGCFFHIRVQYIWREGNMHIYYTANEGINLGFKIIWLGSFPQATWSYRQGMSLELHINNHSPL